MFTNTETMMKSNFTRAALSLGGITASLAITAGAALATGPADHLGDPATWGPDLEALCDDPDRAAAEGYNVIDDPILEQAAGGILLGTNGPDLILANNGNDDVYAGGGNDVVCGGFGEDTLRGEGGNDALFGQAHRDTLRGGNNDDFLGGGAIGDLCDGGNGFDATADCSTVNP
jgi:Ca2+-binding RTX toxin-like protein